MFVDLFRFLDLVMTLGPTLKDQFKDALAEYEEEWKMPFLSNIEREAMDRGHEQGLQEGVQQGVQQGVRQGVQQGASQAAREALIDVLDVRFGETPPHIEEQVRELDDPSILRRLHRRALRVESMEEFERELPSAEDED